ncbi:MAG: glutamine--fructose-6-phosphate transaminase (isomerizing) [Ruminococcaceae bacterium]|nr:glutamine--fructose-6-phosphate transaminase (isomerizing) [Oscillospiraceae bacterium]
MCGIIGYTGSENAEEILINGLHSLEYRGYDSAGVSVSTPDGIKTVKCEGRVSLLEEKLSLFGNLLGNCGIGHTRWATHGEPSERNAHPHNSESLTLVHNGIIENNGELKASLIELGYIFKSDTDTECLAHLLDSFYRKDNDPVSAIIKTVSCLKGSFAFGVIFKDHPDNIYALRKDNPLIVAEGEKGYFLASDVPALSAYAKKVCRVGENEIVCLSSDSCRFYDLQGKEFGGIFEDYDSNGFSASKDGYDYFMLKEMYEQPEAIRRAVGHRLNINGLPDFRVDNIPDSFFENIDSVSIVGCGSASHAGLVGKSIMEKIAKVPVSVNIASEYRYEPPVSYGNTLTVCISQSGETADTLAALRCSKANGSVTLGIVNVVGSTIASECDYVIYTNAGPEIAVATTKGYMTQVAVLAVIAAKISLNKNTVSETYVKEFCHELLYKIPNAVNSVLSRMDEMDLISERIKDCEYLFFIGRGSDNCAAPECSLKLKEISYIHSEAYAAGELKHGTLSLISDGVPVFALAADMKLFEKTASNIREVKSRGGYVVLACNEKIENTEAYADAVFMLPDVDPLLSPMVTVTFAQCVAYKTTLLRGYDVDHPRNLAKSVTVE